MNEARVKWAMYWVALIAALVFALLGFEHPAWFALAFAFVVR